MRTYQMHFLLWPPGSLVVAVDVVVGLVGVGVVFAAAGVVRITMIMIRYICLSPWASGQWNRGTRVRIVTCVVCASAEEDAENEERGGEGGPKGPS